MKYIDNHCHLNFSAFKDDLDDVIKRTIDNEVTVINVGTQRDTSISAVDISDKYDNCYSIVGLHPIHTNKSFHDKAELGVGGEEFCSRGEAFDYDFYKTLCSNPKVVGIGECGLDYYRPMNETLGLEEELSLKKVQLNAFEAQIDLAKETDKPLMLHIRNAYDDAYDILKSNNVSKANVHFFAGDREVAKKFLDLGFTLSFTGVVTFAREYADLVQYVPIDRILSETDSPYVAPVPHRGKRNEPSYVIEVVKKIAEIKGMNLEEVSDTLLNNSKNLFKY